MMFFVRHNNKEEAMKCSRRYFFQTALALPAAAGMGIVSSSFAAAQTPAGSKIKFQLGLASYTCRNFDRAKTIEMACRAELKMMCFKDMHLKMNAADEECAAAAEECKKAGITLYACGVVSMGNADAVNNAFRYAKAAGMKTIVAVPQPGVLSLVEEKVKETGINIAIHNHGPGDNLYPTPESIMEKISVLDKRIGLCVDVGHTARIGADVVKSLRDYKERILDVHFKDETAATPQGKTCICGRGVLDLPAYVSALIEIGYDRTVSFEYEADANDPQPGLMESVGYIRGLMRMLG